jgi:outer membrane protein OmpA-like peptidoglycan-associated protein
MKKQFNLFLFFLFLFSLSFSQKKEKSFKKEFYFATASYDLDSIEMAKAKIYFKLVDKLNLTKIEIYGFTDSDGNKKNNLKLSQNRINTIVNLLKERGCKTEQKVEARGEENPVYKNNTGEKFKNRRVEVVAYYSSKKDIEKKKVTKKVVKEKQRLVAAKKETSIKIEDFKKGKIVALRSVQFYGGTAKFLPGSEEVLDEIVPVLIANPTLKIEIGGHICCGNDRRLSKGRAYSVYKYLIKNGVDEEMLIFKGYNNTQPKYGNIMDIRNRRVELKVL